MDTIERIIRRLVAQLGRKMVVWGLNERDVWFVDTDLQGGAR